MISFMVVAIIFFFLETEVTLDCEGDMLGSTSPFKCAGPALTAVKPQYTTVFDS